MKHVFCALSALALMSLTSCQSSSKSTAASSSSSDSSQAGASCRAADNHLTGQTLRLDYGQMQAEVTYEADTLHWKTFSPSGELTGEGKELPAYSPLGADRYFVAWMEADGTAVSQLLDLREGTIEAILLGPLQPQGDRTPVKLTGMVKPIR